MSIKDLFDKGELKLKVLKEPISSISEKAESEDHIREKIKSKETFIPQVDFNSASNFARFGLAEEYYEQSIKRVYQTYPYDGSRYEKEQWHNSSSYLDKYIFENEYPRQTGFAIFSYDGWGTQIEDQYGYGAPATASYEYITIKGGPNKDEKNVSLKDIFPSNKGTANIYDVSDHRGSNLKIDGQKGNTVEFWLKKDDFNTDQTQKEVIFDSHTPNNISSSAGYGRFRIEMDGESQSSVSAAATATFTFTDKPNEETTITLTDAAGTSVTFEVDNDGDGATGTNTAMDPPTNNAAGMASILISSINASDLQITATTGGGATGEVLLTQDTIGYGGNTLITLSNYSNWDSNTAADFPTYFTGGKDKQGPFLVTYMSGTQGIATASIGSGGGINKDTVADGKWHHYAISLQNAGPALKIKLYVDGEVADEVMTGSAINYVSGAILGTIGALATKISSSVDLSGAVPDIGWGKLSASMDEFRFWKASRSPAQIGRNWFQQVHGGANTDLANTDLGVYYKFNEGISETSSVDNIVLDYSGRTSNGSWTGYAINARSTGSAFNQSFLSSTVGHVPEFKDPIIRTSNPEIDNILESLKSKGKEHDTGNNSAIYYSMPEWITSEDSQNGYELRKLTQIIGNYFDTLALQMKSLPTLKNINYPSSSHKPIPFSDRLLENQGFIAPEIFADAEVLDHFMQQNETRKFDTDISDTKNLIYNNIYNNLSHIFKSKGTEKSFRNLIRCFGIDDELIKINLYGDNVTYKLEENYRQTILKKNYVDFNHPDRHNAVVYQMTSSDNATSVPFISGAAGMMSGSGITLEAEAIFSKKVDSSVKGAFTYSSVTSSLFGFRSPVTDETMGPHILLDDQHEVSGSTAIPSVEVGSHDELYDYDLKVYAVREEAGSPNVTFKVISDKLGLILTSDKYYDVYDNEKWNFAVRFKQKNPEHPLASGVSGSSHDPEANDDDLSGSIEFYGVNVVQNYIQNSFFLSSSIKLGDYTDFVESPKRVYAGAERTNITGSVVNSSDAKISSVRYWLDYVPNEAIKVHAIDPENFGREHPYRNAYLMQDVQAGSPEWRSNLSSSGHYIPQIATLALHWDFATVSGSDSDGRFIVQDLSSGSAGFSGSLSDASEDLGGTLPFDERYGTLGGILNRHHTGQGGLFPANSTKVVDKVYLSTAKQLLPETVASSDMVQIINRDKRLFTRNTRPVNYFIGIEKSPYQTISEEMLKMFASIKDFDNLIGEPVNRYRPNYKKMEKLRQLFFEKIGNVPDLDRYVDYYKWIDVAVDRLIDQLIPISANASENLNTIIESHVLERNKYRTKFPTMDEKYGNREPDQAVDSQKNIPADADGGSRAPEIDFNDHAGSRSDPEKHKFYHFNSTKFSTALSNVPPAGENSVLIHNQGTLWWKYRAERDKVAEISSGDAEVDRQREIFRRVITSNTAASSSAFNVAATAKPQTLSARIESPIGHGSNVSRNKSIFFTKTTLQPRGDANIVLETTGSDNINGNPDFGINPRFFTDDEPVPALNSNIKEKTNFSVRNNLTNEVLKGDIAAHFGMYSYSSSVKAVSREVTNIHDDSYIGRQKPLQGPFTERYVGGNQHRHTRINVGADDTVDTRAEGFRLYVKGDLTDGADASVKLCAADIDPEIKVDSNLPKATLYRDGLAKRPVNIANFKSGALGLGNYTKNYEVVQTSGRSINNKYFVKIEGLVSASQDSIIKDFKDFALPERTRNETVIVEKFSAPGGPEVMSRGFLDTAAEEFSVYNALPFRNLSVRRPLMTLLSRSSGQFGVDSVLGSPSASFHKTHRNTSYRLKYGEDDTVTTASVNDNYFITRQIPQSDLQYSWITASVVAVTGGLEGVGFELLRATDSRSKIPFGYQKSDIAGNGASSDLVFVSSGSLGSYVFNSNNYFGPDRLAQDDISGFIPVDFVGLNTLIHDPISSSINTLGELSPTVTDNSDYTYKGGVVNFLSTTYDGEERIFTALINHRQGSYGWPIWKQVRTGNHPIVRKQKRENIFNFYNTDYYTADLDKSHQNVIVYKDNKKLKQYRIPPVTSKFHPLTENINGVMNIKYSFGNNSSFTTIEDGRLDSKLGIEESFEPRVELDKNIKELMDNPNVQFNVGSTVYKETIWPKEEHTYLSGTRGRIQYAETGGYGSDGIDRVWGEQRTFWRDDPRDRNRTVTNLDGAHDNAAKNSMGFKMNESSSLWKGAGFDYAYYAKNPDQNPVAASVWPLDSNARGYPTGSTGELFSIIDKYFVIDHPSASHTMNTSGDNEYGIEATASQTYFYYNWWGSAAAAALNESISEGNFTADGSEYSGTLEDSPYWLRRFARETPSFGAAAEHGLQFDSDGNYIGPTEEPYDNYSLRRPYYHFRPQYSASALSGKTPWYDSYEDYSENIRPIAKDYGVIPEFKISEHMEYYLNTGFGKKNNKFLSLDGAAITSSANDEIEVPDSDFYKIYSHSDFLKHIDIIKEKNHGQEMSSITLTCKGVKKLLPYNGFYPVLRCVQLGSLFSASYMPNMTSSTSYNAPKAGMIQSLLQPFFAPGIMYNTIKSGIAVDWPAFTGSATPVDLSYRPINTLTTGSDPTNPRYHNYRFPFEALIHPEKYLPRGSGSSAQSVLPDGTPNPDGKLSLVYNYSVANAQFFSGLADGLLLTSDPDGLDQNAIWTGHHDIRYNLAMHNFLGEVPRFFLEDERLTTFASKKGPFTMMSGTTYYMDVVLDKNRDMIMYEGPNPTFKTALSSSADADGNSEGNDIVGWESNGKGARGIHYGPGCSVREDINRTGNSDIYDPTIEFRVSGSRDPAYAPYTPPYFYGESVARIAFSPHKHRELLPSEGPSTFTLEEILEGSKLETIYEPNRSASYSMVDVVPGEQTMAGVGKMKIDSSINLFGKTTVKEVEYSTDLGPNGKYIPISVKDANATDKSFDVWTISSKFETPILNFSGNAESMFTRGMWIGYGEVPKEQDGITLSLRESFPQEVYKSIATEAGTADVEVLEGQDPKAFGSLLKVCGFSTTNTKNKRKLGRIANSKKISEAIVAIPFRASKGKNERRFFNIPRREINKALGIVKGETGVSVQQMVDSMHNYVFPPHHDFLTNKNVRPFAMYIFEFEHTLDRDDLRDIWQNLMPKIAMVPELDEAVIHHPCGVENEFFGEDGIPSDTKWMIYKVKKKAEKNYFNVTADSSDDARFEFEFEVDSEKKSPDYSYNWPYDFFSLVELAKLETEIEFTNNNMMEDNSQENQTEK